MSRHCVTAVATLKGLMNADEKEQAYFDDLQAKNVAFQRALQPFIAETVRKEAHHATLRRDPARDASSTDGLINFLGDVNDSSSTL